MSNSLVNSFLVAFFSFFVASCSNLAKDRGNTLYTVAKTDFSNQLHVSGFLESVNSISIMCPDVNTDLTITYLIEEGSQIAEGDTICILTSTEIENNYESSVQELEIARLEYSKSVENLKLQYLLLESQVRTLEASAQITSLDSAQMAFVSDSQREIIRLGIQKSEIEKEKLQNKLKFLKRINESELVKLKLRIDQARNNAERARESLGKLTIVSKNSGIVEYAHNRSTGKKMAEGDIIWQGQTIIKLPDVSSYQAKLLVDEANFKRIANGQKVSMKVDAVQGLTLNGEVKRKSAGGKPVQRNSKIKVFDVFVSVDSADARLQPGYSLSCNVLLEELKDTLVIPLTALFDNDSTKFVYLKQNGSFKKQVVKVSSQSSTMAVIDSGLAENDRVSVIKPSKYANNK
ncbi:MAG: efflux RND transporter periplasmic adaptor subunit [Bacteroidales bacterium]|nr:efflux RND transporter periplasmic adaptor subunit [Bacteroidales bacterium]